MYAFALTPSLPLKAYVLYGWSLTDLEKVNWDNTLNVSESNVNKSFQNFSNKIKDILVNHVPITKLSLKEKKSSNKP